MILKQLHVVVQYLFIVPKKALHVSLNKAIQICKIWPPHIQMIPHSTV